MRFKGQVAVVTGAASGMGRELCALLAREGAALGLIDRDGKGLATLAAEITAINASCATATVDVCDREATRAAVRLVVEKLGPVDVLVACAGITGITLVDDLAVEDTEAILQVNVLGVAHAIDAVLPDMLARRKGHIVALSSLAGCRGMPFTAAYSASKAALAVYLESLRPALRRRGVAVTTVFPGLVRTPLILSGRFQPGVRMLEPDVAARHILKAILKRPREYSFPWSTSLGVRFLRWLPAGVYDWLMAREAVKIPNLRY